MTTVTLYNNYFEFNFKHEGRVYDSFKIKSSSNSAIYITAFINKIPMKTLQKRIQFDKESNVAYISFGKEHLTIGTYE